jgi:hypothetical protein
MITLSAYAELVHHDEQATAALKHKEELARQRDSEKQRADAAEARLAEALQTIASLKSRLAEVA